LDLVGWSAGASCTVASYTKFGGTIPAVAMVWRPALAMWFDSARCPGGCQRVIRKSKKKDCNINTVVSPTPINGAFGSG
jgi:hypothetical protein